MKKESIWGGGDELTLDIIEKFKLDGVWLDLGAGDGRYVGELLDRVDKLIISDIDREALNKVMEFYKDKAGLEMKVFDLAKKFPFFDNQFDGIFSTGTLHLFTKDKLKEIFNEINRVLKAKGNLIIDFAVDIERTYINGGRGAKETPKYTPEEGNGLLLDLLSDYTIEIYESEFRDDLSGVPGHNVITRGKFILLVCQKKL